MDFSAHTRLVIVMLIATILAALPARGEDDKPGSRLMRLKPPEDRMEWDVTVGAIYFYPLVDIQYSLGDKYSVSVIPTIFHYKYHELTSDLVGGFVALNGYSESYYRGIWCQLGVGLFHSSTTYGIYNEPQLAVSGLVTAGYRFRIGQLNAGVAFGGEYHDLQKSKNIPHSYLLAPITWVDVGWAF